MDSRDFDWPVDRDDLIAAVAPLFGAAIFEQTSGIPAVSLRAGVCLRRISPVTGEAYPRSADTCALRPLWDQRLANWVRLARGEDIERGDLAPAPPPLTEPRTSWVHELIRDALAIPRRWLR